MSTNFRARCEPLEDRTTPANFGTAWLDPSLITISFANDGTAIVDHQSNLFESFNNGTAQNWQLEILRALQTWAVHANINLAVVQDQGVAFGTPGLAQHDSRFGDIRIGGFTQSLEVLATAAPPDLFAGTWSGDIFLNTAYQFGIGDPNSLDIFTIMLHEAGHAFGLPESDSLDSVMSDYFGFRNSLSTTDIANLQALYGVRTPDAYEGSSGNDTLQTATSLKSNGKTGNELFLAYGDLSTQDDIDIFQFKTQGNTSSFSIRLRTNGVSLLTPKLSVYDSDGNQVASLTAQGPLDDDLFVELGNLKKGGEYFVRIESATDDVFGIGSYRLEVDLEPETVDPDAHDAVFADSDLAFVEEGKPNGNAFGGAEMLKVKDGMHDGFHHQVSSSIASRSDLDMFRVQSPSGASNMTVTVRSSDSLGLSPRIQLFNNQREPLDAQVLINADGSFTIQLEQVESNKWYYIAITSSETEGSGIGEYFLGVDFSNEPHVLDTLADGQLTQESSANETTLSVTENQLFHFALGSEDGPVRMTVRDAEGNILFSLESTGEVRTGNVILKSGEYVVQVEALENGQPSFSLRYLTMSDPIGPQIEDVVGQPVEESGIADGGYVVVETPPPLLDDPAAPETTPDTPAPPPAGDNGPSAPTSRQKPPDSDWLATEDPISDSTWDDGWVTPGPVSFPPGSGNDSGTVVDTGSGIGSGTGTSESDMAVSETTTTPSDPTAPAVPVSVVDTSTVADQPAPSTPPPTQPTNDSPSDTRDVAPHETGSDVGEAVNDLVADTDGITDPATPPASDTVAGGDPVQSADQGTTPESSNSDSETADPAVDLGSVADNPPDDSDADMAPAHAGAVNDLSPTETPAEAAAPTAAGEAETVVADDPQGSDSNTTPVDVDADDTGDPSTPVAETAAVPDADDAPSQEAGSEEHATAAADGDRTTEEIAAAPDTPQPSANVGERQQLAADDRRSPADQPTTEVGMPTTTADSDVQVAIADQLDQPEAEPSDATLLGKIAEVAWFMGVLIVLGLGAGKE